MSILAMRLGFVGSRRGTAVGVLLALGATAPFVLGGCSRSEKRVPRALELLQVRPAGQTLFLNDRLDFFFSEPLDRASVTSASVSIRTNDGGLHVATGRRLVDGERLTFVPDAVKSPVLDDGGFLPGRTYVVEFAGFPRPDGLRGTYGASLAETLRLEFTTPSPEEGGEPLFDDTTPESSSPLRAVGVTYQAGGLGAIVTIAPDAAIVFEGNEPIDPRSLDDDHFRLRRHPPTSEEGRIPVDAVLVANEVGPGRTRLELRPRAILDEGRYNLRIRRELTILDFAGRPVFLYAGGNNAGGLGVEVSTSVSRGQSTWERHSFREEFSDDTMRSSARHDLADGTAHWGEGRIQFRYPRSAGDGGDGDVALQGEEDRSDVAAERLRLAADETCRLTTAESLVVLRSQGTLTIDGTLERAAEGPAPPVGGAQSVFSWLGRARADGTTATVLIAGGDLVVNGEIRSGGPLLLVAGGRIRLSSECRIAIGAGALEAFPREGSLVSTSELGGLRDTPVLALWPRTGGAAPFWESGDLGLGLEPPTENLLRRDVTLAVLSNAIPGPRSGVRFRSSPVVVASAGRGEVRVVYIGDRGARESGEPYQVEREDPQRLADVQALRFRVELTMKPGTPWDPPWVDAIEIEWDLPR